MFGKPQKKRSFFEKLTGAVSADEFDDEFEIEERRAIVHADDEEDGVLSTSSSRPSPTHVIPDGDGQLAVDVVNTDDSIIVRAMLAGVKPGEIDIDIARDMVTIRGTREEESESITDDYYHRELFWGTFSRNIILPEEIDVELAEATEKHGLLTLRLPKVDKNRRQKLHVKSK